MKIYKPLFLYFAREFPIHVELPLNLDTSKRRVECAMLYGSVPSRRKQREANVEIRTRIVHSW